VQAISAHFLWLSFLTEQWAIISRLRDARTAAARVMYGRLLAASLQDPAVLSHHPAAVGAYFRLLTLGLKYGRSCLRGGPATAGKDVLLLFDRILQAVSRLVDPVAVCALPVTLQSCRQCAEHQSPFSLLLLHTDHSACICLSNVMFPATGVLQL
jgi:hypothetical protein